MVRLGFIIGFIALLGALLSGLAAYRVHDQELALDRIALARAIDVHASLVQDRLTERELLARVASGLFRAPSVIKPNMLEPLRSAIYAFKTDFVVAGWIARIKPDELTAAQAAIGGAGFPNPKIRSYDDKPINPADITGPIDVLLDLEPRSDETKALPGRSYDQDQVRSAMLTRARTEKRSVASDPIRLLRGNGPVGIIVAAPVIPEGATEPAGFVTFSYEPRLAHADQRRHVVVLGRAEGSTQGRRRADRQRPGRGLDARAGGGRVGTVRDAHGELRWPRLATRLLREIQLGAPRGADRDHRGGDRLCDHGDGVRSVRLCRLQQFAAEPGNPGPHRLRAPAHRCDRRGSITGSRTSWR